ncbi:MAG: aldehyde dehydrogenase family protein [Actinomycetes bacterium]
MTATATPPVNPATPDLDAPALVESLRTTFATGRTRDAAWRTAQLRALHRMLAEQEEPLLEALRTDLGKPAIEAFLTEIAFVRAEVDVTLKHLRRWMRPERVGIPVKQQPGRARIHRDPLGVVLIIGPWNYPVQLLLAPLVGAIAAGNCAVLKPSEVSPTVSATLARIVPQYLDRDAVRVVEGAVPETSALLEQRWDHIFYTGNGTIGRVVMGAAAKHLTPVTLELGGKSPTYVDASANLAVAARRIAWGKFLNSGQTCIAPDYVLVDRSVEAAFVEHLRAAVHGFFGDDPSTSPDFGRIVNGRHFARIRALADGAGAGTPAFGGRHDEASRYIEPCALLGVDPSARIMQEEIFGPVLPILGVDGVDEAIRFINDRDKPLALYIFAERGAVTDRILAETSSGGVCVNATLYHLVPPTLPFGGVGESGQGAYHGRSTFETFSHRKSVLRKPTRLDPPIAYPPYTEQKQKLIRRFL